RFVQRNAAELGAAVAAIAPQHEVASEHAEQQRIGTLGQCRTPARRQERDEFASPPCEESRQRRSGVARAQSRKQDVGSCDFHREASSSRQRSTVYGRPAAPTPPKRMLASSTVLAPLASVARDLIVYVFPPPLATIGVPSGSVNACAS